MTYNFGIPQGYVLSVDTNDSVSIWIEVCLVAVVTSLLRVYLPIAGVIDEIEQGDALGT